MKKGFTLPELTVTLSILVLSLTALIALATGYLSILNSYRQRFLGLNVTQEGVEIALALRNKQIEKGESRNWLGVTEAGTYCINFDPISRQIKVYPSSNPCEVFYGYRRLIRYSDFENSSNNNLTTTRAVKVISETYFNNNKISLDIVLTKWHPIQ